MSFILDALEKADRQRHLGELPGIHSRSIPAAGLPLPSPLLQRRSTWLLATLPIVGLIAWNMMQFWPAMVITRTPVQMTSRAASSHAAPLTPALALAPTTSLNPTPTSVTAVSTAADDIPVPPPLPAPASAAARPGPATALQTARPVAAGGAAKNAGLPAKQPANKPPEQPATSNLITDLPPNLQKEIPTLAIAGSIYSTNAADRMLLIDKRMLHEGEEIAPGLVLETVMPKAAMLRYKGYAFRVVF